MGSRVSPISSYSLCHSNKSPCPIPSLQLGNVIQNNIGMPCRLIYGSASALCSSRNLRMHIVKQACFAPYNDEFYHGTKHKKIAHAAVSDIGSSEVKHDVLDPSLLGIQPESPSWPERDEILRLNFERKVNSVGIPLSIRMIKKKLQWEKGLTETSEFTSCSVKRVFSSMLFIIHELQNHVLQTREILCCEDLQGAMTKLQGDLDASFVWLFQNVFWKSPNLMVNVMVLLANFSVFSMCDNPVMTNNRNKLLQHSQGEYRKQELTEDEEMLWKSMLEEGSRWQNELQSEALDHETVLKFVAPVSIQLEGDQYEEYVKTSLYYTKHLRQAPYNSLLLSNYAQFLYLVVQDLDRAEEYFRRSVLVEPPDAEAFSRYADFLWLARKDLEAAEHRYQQALEEEPWNTYYASKYANLLWSTGGKDTCFPLESPDNLPP